VSQGSEAAAFRICQAQSTAAELGEGVSELLISCGRVYVNERRRPSHRPLRQPAQSPGYPNDLAVATSAVRAHSFPDTPGFSGKSLIH